MIMDAAFVVRCLLIALAVYRLAWMFTREDGPFNVFEWVRCWLGKQAAKKQEHGLAWTLAEVSNCTHCAGLWLALIGSLFVIFPSYYSDVLILILAIAGLQSFMTGRNNDE